MSRESTKVRARGRWQEILPQLGIDIRLLDGNHHPCPIPGCPDGGGKDRFRFDDKDGEGTWFCNKGHGGQAGDGIKLARLMLGEEFLPTVQRIDGLLGQVGSPSVSGGKKPDPAFIQRAIEQMRRDSVRVQAGDPVDLYLRSRVPGLRFVPAALRTLREAEHRSKITKAVSVRPAMLAIVSDHLGDPISVHRTFLTPEGGKADVPKDEQRMNLGSLPDGVAIRLAKPAKAMGVAEGIETALSAMAIYRIPVWSTMNAGRLKVWTPPAGVEQIVVFADNDAGKEGQSAGFALAERLERLGIETEVTYPALAGTDWNDVHNGRAPGPDGMMFGKSETS